MKIKFFLFAGRLMTCLLFFFLSATVKGGQKNTGDLMELLTAEKTPPSPESEHQTDSLTDDGAVPVSAEEAGKFLQLLAADYALPKSLLPKLAELVSNHHPVYLS